MTINNNIDQSKLVIIKGSGTIRELGNICAPILTPQYISTGIVAKLVSSGRTVLEVNPADRNQTVKLTLANVRSNNFPTAPAAEPAKVTAPAKTEAKKEEKKDAPKTVAPAKVEAKPEPAKTTSTPASDFTAK